MFEELKKAVSKELKKVKMIMSHQMENINIRGKIIFKSPMEILELKVQ